MRAVTIYQDKRGVALHAGHWLLTSTIVFTLGAAETLAGWHHAPSQASTYPNIYLHVMGLAQTFHTDSKGRQFNKLVVTLILQLS